MARCFSPASSACTAARKALLHAARSGCEPGRRSGRARNRAAAGQADPALSRRSKSKSNWRRMGSTMAPWWRKASRVPVRTTRASSSGLAMPATAFIARIECRMEAAGTSSSRRTRRVLNWPEILEGVGLLLRNQPGSLPPLQLAGTDLQDAQNVLTAIAGHSCRAPTGGTVCPGS